MSQWDSSFKPGKHVQNDGLGLGAQKTHLIEMVVLSTHNLCFDWEMI